MRHLITYKIFESTDDIFYNLEDIFIDYKYYPPKVASTSILEEPIHSLDVSVDKCNPERYSRYTQLHNRANYKILIGLKVDKDSEDADFLTSHVDDDLVELLERSIDYMDSIGYDYKIGYGWDGDTYTDGGVDMEDDMENIYDYEILADTFIGVYFFKREDISESKIFESTQIERQKSRENAEGIRSDIIDIFYDLEDLDFSIYVQLNAITLYEWTYQVRIGKIDDTSFSFDEVQETIERFIDYINPYVGVSSSFPGRNPIDFQIEHYRWSLHDRLKYNLSYDDMKKVMDKDDTGGAGWVDGRHVTPKLGDRLRTIYIDVKVRC